MKTALTFLVCFVVLGAVDLLCLYLSCQLLMWMLDCTVGEALFYNLIGCMVVRAWRSAKTATTIVLKRIV